MTHTSSVQGYRLYWGIWGVLLVLTLGMILFDQSPLPRLILVCFLVVTMLVKACLIAGYFMHLRYENIAIILTVIVGLLLVGMVMFGLMIPDASTAQELARPTR